MKMVNCKLMTIANEHFNCIKKVRCKVTKMKTRGAGGDRGVLRGWQGM